MIKYSKSQHWYDAPAAAAGLSVLGLAAACGLASRALDTGSLQQYALTIVSAGFAINRAVQAVRAKRRLT